LPRHRTAQPEDDLRRAEAALLRSEARYRTLFDSIDQGFCVIEMLFDGDKPTDYHFLEVNAAFTRQTGIADPIGRTMRSIESAHEDHWFEIYGRVARERQAVRFENAAEKLGHFYEVYAFPVDAPDQLRVGILFNDISRRRRQHQALQESEHRFRSLVEGVPQLVWRAVEDGCWIWASSQWVSQTGLSVEESLGTGWLAAVHPEDREETVAAWRKASEEGQGFEAHHRLYHRDEGRYRWFQTRAAPLRGDGGEIIEWLGTSTDVDELRRLQEHQRILLAELQHRVRNTLAVVRSIARQTAVSSMDAASYARNLEGRIDSFARVQAAVPRSPATGVDLQQLVKDELSAVCAEQDARVAREGDTALLQPKAAETLALVIHELATNAVKHGALSSEAGRLRVGSRLEGDARAGSLGLEWVETAPRTAFSRGRRGFGMDIIERLLPYEFDATVTLDFGPDGLRCEIRLPVSARLLV